jgi:hypothetical protein
MKDERTKRMRKTIAKLAPAVVEGLRAEVGQNTLSFHSEWGIS